MIIVDAVRLEAAVAGIFAAAGCSAAEAARVARSLVAANLAGHDSHGVQRVPRYLAALRDGDVVADETVRIESETAVLAVLDGRRGFGQTVGPQAVEIGVGKCRDAGLAAIALGNAGHLGRLGEWAELAADAGLASVHFANVAGSSIVAPFGGIDRRFSTAPFCMAVPRRGQPPLVLDFATSVVAEGKVMHATLGGPPIAPDALIAADGTTTDDPRALYGDFEPTGPRDSRRGTGALRAFGDHKGSGLALMCELLGGALTGNGTAQGGPSPTNGMFSIYVDPGRAGVQGFADEVHRFAEHVRASRPRIPGRDVLLPGEPELRHRAERLRDGVPLPQHTVDAIVRAAREVGATMDRLA